MCVLHKDLDLMSSNAFDRILIMNSLIGPVLLLFCEIDKVSLRPSGTFTAANSTHITIYKHWLGTSCHYYRLNDLYYFQECLSILDIAEGSKNTDTCKPSNSSIRFPFSV